MTEADKDNELSHTGKSQWFKVFVPKFLEYEIKEILSNPKYYFSFYNKGVLAHNGHDKFEN